MAGASGREIALRAGRPFTSVCRLSVDVGVTRQFRQSSRNSPWQFDTQRALRCGHHGRAWIGLAEVLYRFGGLGELEEIHDGVADARIVVTAEPHRDAGKILEAQ